MTAKREGPVSVSSTPRSQDQKPSTPSQGNQQPLCKMDKKESHEPILLPVISKSHIIRDNGYEIPFTQWNLDQYLLNK